MHFMRNNYLLHDCLDSTYPLRRCFLFENLEMTKFTGIADMGTPTELFGEMLAVFFMDEVYRNRVAVFCTEFHFRTELLSFSFWHLTSLNNQRLPYFLINNVFYFFLFFIGHFTIK